MRCKDGFYLHCATTWTFLLQKAGDTTRIRSMANFFLATTQKSMSILVVLLKYWHLSVVSLFWKSFLNSSKTLVSTLFHKTIWRRREERKKINDETVVCERNAFSLKVSLCRMQYTVAADFPKVTSKWFLYYLHQADAARAPLLLSFGVIYGLENVPQAKNKGFDSSRSKAACHVLGGKRFGLLQLIYRHGDRAYSI